MIFVLMLVSLAIANEPKVVQVPKVFAYSAKQLWDSQGQEQDLDRAYRQFRIKLGMRGQD